MRWGITIGLMLAVAWQTARLAIAQMPPTGVPGVVRSAPDPAWPVQPAAYQAPVTAPAPPPTGPNPNLPGTISASASTPPTGTTASRPLPTRKAEAHPTNLGQGETAGSARPGSLGSLVTVMAGLALVLGLFLFVAWLMRKAAPTGSAVLPKEVFEILGRAPLASRHQVHLVRCGRKLLLLSVSQGGIETLSEIEDPVEVDRLAGLCLQAQPGSASMVFRQVFQQFTASQGRALPGSDRSAEIRHA